MYPYPSCLLLEWGNPFLTRPKVIPSVNSKYDSANRSSLSQLRLSTQTRSNPSAFPYCSASRTVSFSLLRYFKHSLQFSLSLLFVSSGTEWRWYLKTCVSSTTRCYCVVLTSNNKTTCPFCCEQHSASFFCYPPKLPSFLFLVFVFVF